MIRRKAIIELLDGIEIDRCPVGDRTTYKISAKSKADIADFIQEILLQQKNERQYDKRKG